jgi:hypothetical protein
MSKVSSFETDTARARAILEDAFKGVEATDAALAEHSKGPANLDAVNLPVEEAMVSETIALLDRWKNQAAAIVTSLDTATAAAQLRFERLFDENAGREKSGFLGRRIHLGHAAPASISAELHALLSGTAALDAAFQRARPDFLARSRGCEDHLLRIIERRQRADASIEDGHRRMDALTPRIADRKSRIGTARNAAALATFEEDLRALIAEYEMLQESERHLTPERETLQRLIAIYEDFVEALNAQLAAVNAMAAKLRIDAEQRIMLLKATDAQQAGDIRQVRTPPVVAMFEAFEANILAGYDLPARKAKADAAFARRLGPAPQPPEEPATEAEPEEPQEETPAEA